MRPAMRALRDTEATATEGGALAAAPMVGAATVGDATVGDATVGDATNASAAERTTPRAGGPGGAKRVAGGVPQAAAESAATCAERRDT